jgi:hypothetical protein
MASKTKAEATASEKSSGVNPEEILKPFQEASVKFLQANFAAQEAIVKQNAQASFELQEEARKIEQAAYDSVAEATKKHAESMGQETKGSPEEIYAARAQAQLDYEKEVSQVYIDTQAKLTGIAQKAFGDSGEEVAKQFTNEQQGLYQVYLRDLQQAWAETKDLDPQIINAIATDILFTINTAGGSGVGNG